MFYTSYSILRKIGVNLWISGSNIVYACFVSFKTYCDIKKENFLKIEFDVEGFD